MADIRIKDLATTASSAASDDFMALDGATNGTRKMSAANPSVTTLTTSGVIAPGGSVHGANGSAANPSFAFNSDQNTGLYRIGINNIGVAANGAKVLDIATTGLTVTGALGASSLTSPASTNLTLGLGTGGTALTLTNSTLAATFAGAVTVSSSTAGSSGAGALVVTGGLSAGGASYFGGTVTVNGAGRFVNVFNNASGGYSTGFSVGGNDGTATTRGVSLTFFDGAAYHNWASYSGYLTLGSGTTEFGIMSTTQNGLTPDPDGTMLFKIQRATGAATFGGAVTVGGNIGFYNNAPVAKPTGVAVTAAAIHAALVTLNLISA